MIISGELERHCHLVFELFALFIMAVWMLVNISWPGIDVSEENSDAHLNANRISA